MSSKGKRRLVMVGGIVAGYAAGTVIAMRRGYTFGSRVPVRCRGGHLFTTVWIPGVSVKSLRLGLWRVQWCPVGRHVTLVTLLKDADLSENERVLAAEHHDAPVP